MKKRARFQVIMTALCFLFAVGNTFSQDSWEATNGPFGGSIKSFAVGGSATVFAGTEGGVYRSDDHGGAWRPSGLDGLSIHMLAVKDDVDVFAATQLGLYRSTDGGANWTIATIAGHSEFTLFSVAVSSNGHLFAGSFIEGNIFRSVDNGESWTTLDTGLPDDEYVYALAINQAGHIFAGTDMGNMLRSTDNGDSWVKRNTGLPGTLEILELAVNQQGMIFAATNESVFRSTNNGDNWIAVKTGLPSFDTVAALAVNSQGQIFAGTINNGVFRSDNNGDSWTGVGNLTTHLIVALAIDEVSIYAGNTAGAGVFRSTDNGASWMVSNAGLTNTYVGALVVNADRYLFADIGNEGSQVAMHRSSDQGQSWTPAGLAGEFVNALASNKAGHVFAGAFGGMFRTLDNGESWTAINSGLPQSIDILAVAVSPAGSVFAGSRDGGVFRSRDNGDNWTALDTGLSTFFNDVRTIAINDDGHVFVGADSDGIIRSTDDGDSWTTVNNGLPFFPHIEAIATDDLGQLFAGDWNGLYRSVDNGATWTEIDGGPAFVHQFAVTGAGDIIAATFDGGVYRTTDRGDNWTAIQTGLPNVNVVALAVDSDGRVFAGTWGNGLFRSAASPTSVADLSGEMPTSFSLEQNYPNPFNPGTTIQFALPRASEVTLKIYNILGREVATLVTENLTAGQHKVNWHAGGLANGVYYYRLQAGAYVETKKLTLLK